MMALDIEGLLAEAAAIVESADAELVPVVLAGRSAGVRFVPISGAAWRECAPRECEAGCESWVQR